MVREAWIPLTCWADMYILMNHYKDRRVLHVVDDGKEYTVTLYQGGEKEKIR